MGRWRRDPGHRPAKLAAEQEGVDEVADEAAALQRTRQLDALVNASFGIDSGGARGRR
jgi:hypothetical protein